MRPQNRKIHSKGRPLQQTKNYKCIYLSNQHIDLEQRRPAHAKPDINWLSGPRNGTWKRTCGISCLSSLAPMWRFAMQHHPGNIHQSFATPRYSATPCFVIIQVPNVIETISKRWLSKKAFNTSLSHIFSKQIPTSSRFLFFAITEEARTCKAWFQLTFRPQKWNLKAHMWYQLSPFPSSNVAICDAAPPTQHSPILRYSALLRYSVLCFNSITQCNWHDIETMAE